MYGWYCFKPWVFNLPAFGYSRKQNNRRVVIIIIVRCLKHTTRRKTLIIDRQPSPWKNVNANKVHCTYARTWVHTEMPKMAPRWQWFICVTRATAVQRYYYAHILRSLTLSWFMGPRKTPKRPVVIDFPRGGGSTRAKAGG